MNGNGNGDQDKLQLGGAGVRPHKDAADELAQDWLWNTSSEIVGLPTEL